MDLVGTVTPEERAAITGLPPDAAVVSAIWTRLGVRGEWGELPATGVANFIYATDDVVLRIATLHPDGVSDARTESVASPVTLAAGIRTPRLFAFDDSRELIDRPYTLWQRLHLDTLGLLEDESAIERGWRGVGAQLAILHRAVTACPDPDGWLDTPGFDTPHASLERALAAGTVDSATAGWLSTWLWRLDSTIPPAGPDRFLHGDLYAMNVMCRPNGDEATLIDWGDAGWGEPAFDFADIPPRFLPAVLAAYEAGGGTPRGAGLEGRILWVQIARTLGRAARGRPQDAALAALLAFAETAPDPLARVLFAPTRPPESRPPVTAGVAESAQRRLSRSLQQPLPPLHKRLLLQREQRLLPLKPAPVPHQRTVRPDHPVAGHDNPDRVPPVRRPHRPRGVRVPDALRQLAVVDGRAVRDVSQGPPDFDLERRPGRGKFEFELRPLARKVLPELRTRLHEGPGLPHPTRLHTLRVPLVRHHQTRKRPPIGHQHQVAHRTRTNIEIGDSGSNNHDTSPLRTRNSAIGTHPRGASPRMPATDATPPPVRGRGPDSAHTAPS